MPIRSKKFQNFWSHSSTFAIKNQPKKFKSLLALRDSLVATFTETREPTSRKILAEEGKVLLS